MEERRRPLTIDVVSDAVYPYHTGGKETRYRIVIEGLARQGHRIRVNTMHWWNDPAPVQPETALGTGTITYRAIGPKTEMYHPNGRRSIRQGLRFAVDCLRLINTRADIIEADHMPYLQIYPLWLIAKLRRKPLIVTWHEYWGRDYWRTYMGLPGLVAALIEYGAAHLPDHIVAVSEETRTRLLGVGVKPDRVDVVLCGTDAHSNSVRNAISNDTERVIEIVSAGRLIEHKRIDVAVAAIETLTRRGRRVRLTVAGDGPERERLETLARNVSADITFIGELATQQDVWDLMARSDIYLSPSEREGFGLSVAEAMRLGTPVVISDHPDNAATRLVTAGCGTIAAAGNPEAFADAVEAIIGNPRPDVSEEFRRHHPELSAETTVLRQDAVYHAALTRKHASRWRRRNPARRTSGAAATTGHAAPQPPGPEQTVTKKTATKKTATQRTATNTTTMNTTTMNEAAT